jgi:hypothetical protein
MRMNVLFARSLVVAIAWGLAVVVSGQAQPDVQLVLSRVAERIEQYYKRAQNIICIEKVTATPVRSDMAPDGFARVLEYDLHVESDTAADDGRPTDARVVRELRKVNGRPPRPKDQKGCLDPNPLSPEPLEFLLQRNRAEYQFSWAGFGKGKERNTMLIDFRSLETGKPQLIEDAEGRPDCFSISLPGATRGRLWIDVETHNVLRIEEHLITRLDVRVPQPMQKKHHLDQELTIERYDWTIRYKSVAFENPAETLLLPESIEVLAVMHGAQSHRKRQVFSDYKRFMTGARVIRDD